MFSSLLTQFPDLHTACQDRPARQVSADAAVGELSVLCGCSFSDGVLTVSDPATTIETIYVPWRSCPIFLFCFTVPGLWSYWARFLQASCPIVERAYVLPNQGHPPQKLAVAMSMLAILAQHARQGQPRRTRSWRKPRLLYPTSCSSVCRTRFIVVHEDDRGHLSAISCHDRFADLRADLIWTLLPASRARRKSTRFGSRCIAGLCCQDLTGGT